MKTPEAITPAVALRPRRLDVFVERINAALGESWTPKEVKDGRAIAVKHADKTTAEDLAKHFRSAGWAVDVGNDTLVFRPVYTP